MVSHARSKGPRERRKGTHLGNSVELLAREGAQQRPREVERFKAGTILRDALVDELVLKLQIGDAQGTSARDPTTVRDVGVAMDSMMVQML